MFFHYGYEPRKREAWDDPTSKRKPEGPWQKLSRRGAELASLLNLPGAKAQTSARFAMSRKWFL